MGAHAARYWVKVIQPPQPLCGSRKSTSRCHGAHQVAVDAYIHHNSARFNPLAANDLPLAHRNTSRFSTPLTCRPDPWLNAISRTVVVQPAPAVTPAPLGGRTLNNIGRAQPPVAFIPYRSTPVLASKAFDAKWRARAVTAACAGQPANMNGVKTHPTSLSAANTLPAAVRVQMDRERQLLPAMPSNASISFRGSISSSNVWLAGIQRAGRRSER